MSNQEMAACNEQRPLISFWTANTTSGLGGNLTAVAIPWFVLVTTGSAAKTGLTAFFEVVPLVVFSFLGSGLVDRFGFKRVSVTTDVVSGIVVAGIPVLYAIHLLQFWHILVFAFLSGAVGAPADTARSALVPDLVEMARMPLERVNSISQVLGTGTGLIVPALAGLLIAFMGATNVLWLDAASFLVSAGLFVFMVPALPAHVAPHPDIRPSAKGVSSRLRGYVAELSDGLKFIRGERLILTLILIAVVGNFLSVPLLRVVLPAYAKRSFGSAVELGLMLAFVSGGMMIGTFLYVAFGHRFSRRPVYIGVAFAIAILISALATLPPLPFFLAILAGPGNPIGYTILQERTPAQLRGRVFGTTTALLLPATPFGLLLWGYL